MPAEFFIDVPNRLVCSYAWGVVTRADALCHMERLSADHRFDGSFHQIVDFRDTTSMELTAEQIRELSRRPVYAPSSRRAFVMAADVQFGLGRMFAAFRELEGEPNIRIVRDMPEALAWTRVTAEVAEAAFARLRAA